MKLYLIAPLLAWGFLSSLAVNAEPLYEKGQTYSGDKWIRGKINSIENPEVKLGFFCRFDGQFNSTSIDTVFDPSSSPGVDSWAIPLSGVKVSWDNQEPVTYLWLHASSNNLRMSKTYKSKYGGLEGRTTSEITRGYTRKLLDHKKMSISYSVSRPRPINYQEKSASFDLEKFHPLLIKAKSEGCEDLS